MDVLQGAGSRSRSEVQRALMPANDLRTMRGEVFAVLPAEHPIRADQRPYYRDPRLRRLVPDPEKTDVLVGLRRQYPLSDPGLGVKIPDQEAVQDAIHTQQDEGEYMQSGDVPPRVVPGSASGGGHPAPNRDTIAATTEVSAVPDPDDVVISPQPDGAHLLQGVHVRVLELMAEGSTNAQIAVALDLKEQSVKNYVNTIYGRLGIQTRGEQGRRDAVAVARARRVISPKVSRDGDERS